MKKNPLNYEPGMKNGYIQPPYVLEEGDKINDFYLEPVLFHNENGPTIGVTTCGVIATCVVCNPWILEKLEPYCDGLTFQYTVSPVAMDNALGAQMDVLSGAFNPTGKMSLTMVSCNDVIAITEKEIDGEIREICASPNDVPGYDKDQYIDPAILSTVRGGSYAYCDADGNYYRSGFGLHY